MRRFLHPMILFLICSCATTSPIHNAVIQNNLTEVKSYVERGEIEMPDGNGATPLIAASYYGHESIVKYLCDKGAKVDQRDYGGWTALMYATYYNNYNIAKILLDNNAAVDIENNEGHTALFYAQEYQHNQIVMLLKKSKKDLQIKKKTKSPPVKPAKKKSKKHKSAASLNPSIKILGIKITPSPVPAKSKFDLVVWYLVKDPAVQDDKIPVQFSFTILRDAKVLAEKKPKIVNSFNSEPTKRIEKKQTAAEEEGNYKIEVSLRYKDKSAKRTVDLIIK